MTRILVSAALWILLLASSNAQAGADLQALQDQAPALLQKYIRVDTVNPPGNEARAAKFFAAIFDKEGIPYETAESAPGRGNIAARLKGGDKPALILLSHMDVVPADAADWQVKPFAGVVKDGYIYGRGALDMKSIGIVFLQVLRALHDAGRPLDRDVIFMGTADEEAGGELGAGWVVKNRPEWFRGAGMLLTEGGGGTTYGDRTVFSIEVAQKIPLWIRLTATGEPGHGAAPHVHSAPGRLIAALSRIQDHPFAPHIVPSVDAYFKGLAGLQQEKEWRDAYANLQEALKDPEFPLRLQLHNHGQHALIRNTCSLTRLKGSDKINVVPQEASAELDCRLLPDQDAGKFIDLIKTIIDDDHVKVDVVMTFSAAASRTGTPLYQALSRGIKQHYPMAVILPGVSGGFTDSHYFRDLGIDSYGFAPFLVPHGDGSGVHGNNERIAITNLKQGLRMLLDIINPLVYGSK
jgi:acetylornithine deacetylase/succinyl-diaminopimelate desuccinylase-like protein